MTILPEAITPGVTTGHDPHHERMHLIHNLGPTFIDVRSYGAVGNNVANDSAAITDALAKGPSFGIVRFPAGEYLINPGTLALLASRHIMGDGADTTWFRLSANTTTAALQISVPSPTGSVRGVYGPRVKGIGINLAGAASATGIRVGAAGGDGLGSNWTWLDDVRVEGGVVSLHVESTNTKVTNFHFIDPSTSFILIPATGQEFRCWDGVLDCTPTKTVAIAVDIPILVHGAAGAVYMRDIALNNGGTVNKGIYAHAPNGGSASVPVRAIHLTLDNLAGPGYDLENVSDAQIMGGWVNSAAGVGNGAIRFYGGGGHTVMGVEQLNGGTGAACTYDFAGGAPSGIALVGNNPATGPYYRLAASGKPTDLLALDRLWNVAVLANVTNDMPGLMAAMSPLWTPPRHAQYPLVRESGTNPPQGYNSFPGGTPNSRLIAHTGIKANTRVKVSRERFGATGTAGQIACSTADHVVGASFTVFSNSATDVGSFYWWIEDVY